MPATTRTIYQLKIQLRDVDPPIWRRVDVWADITLAQLHQVLQIVMGWEDSHLHQFDIGERLYGLPEILEGDVADERRTRLKSAVRKVGVGFTYEYDFGDSWRLDIVIESILSPEPKGRYPRCVDGRRSGPPEDSGGPYGYADYLEALADPKHERHQEMLDWRGPFDPEDFSIDRVNKALRRAFGLTRKRTPGSGRQRSALTPEVEAEIRRMLELILNPGAAAPRRKRVRPDERLPIELNERERELIVKHSFADDHLTRRLRLIPKPRAAPVYRYTLGEIDELSGCIAFHANHENNAKLRREWDRLFERLNAMLEQYTDEEEEP
jgi:hypothetical protein